MAEEPKKKKGWKTKAEMREVGGHKGKLHRELGIDEDKPIPKERLEAAEHSENPEIKRDAVRAKTMEGWHHGRKATAKALYTHPRSVKSRSAHG